MSLREILQILVVHYIFFLHIKEQLCNGIVIFEITNCYALMTFSLLVL